MFHDRVRLAAWIVLVFAVGLTWWGCCTAEKTAAVVFIGLGQNVRGGPPVRPDKATIHVSRKEQLIWKAAPGGRLTSISIALGSNPPPFQKCGAGSPCLINCDPDGVCVSGPIRDGLNPPPSGFYYEYTTAFAAAAQSDPGLIIKP